FAIRSLCVVFGFRVSPVFFYIKQNNIHHSRVAKTDASFYIS
ncbi:MAG: hypothetical protein UZ22_OP11002000265, partial [Microgenomates bacterium OLB23]